MLQVFVITKDGTLSRAVKRYFTLTGGAAVHEYHLHGAETMTPGQVPSYFRRVADWLEGTAGQYGAPFALREAVAVIDLDDPVPTSFNGLNPATVNQGRWAAVVAMLVLAFPEVHWVFDTFYAPLNPLFEKLHMLRGGSTLRDVTALRRAGYTPLFDPTGLRNAIRGQLGGTPDSDYVPARGQVAAAVDEEAAYTYFNAYIAYRIGFRTHVISSNALMSEVLNGRGAVSLVFEDLYLNFPDKPHDNHYSKLAERDQQFPGLADADYRVIITVGHSRTADPQTADDNKIFKEKWRARGRLIETLYKPLSGIFDVWRKSGVRDWLKASGGHAPEFKWPPPLEEGGKAPGTHSASGRMLEVSDRLIQRARVVAQSAHTVPDAVYGAVLALEAQEYLGHRTPTSSLEALALQHTLEVNAECLFYGVEYNKDVDSRFEEIKRDVNSIGRWLRPQTQRLSSLDAEIGIVSDLVIRFREHYQFDEEQKCLNKLRDLHRQLWALKHRPWSLLFQPFRWYVEKLLNSIAVFTLAIAGWILILSFAFSFQCVVCHHNAVEKEVGKLKKEEMREQRKKAMEAAALARSSPPADAPLPPVAPSAATSLTAAPKKVTPTPADAAPASTPPPDEVSMRIEEEERRREEEIQLAAEMKVHGWGIEHGLAHSITAFFGIQPAHGAETFEEYPVWVLVLNVLAIFAGFAHLGIFVSHLYSLVARR